MPSARSFSAARAAWEATACRIVSHSVTGWPKERVTATDRRGEAITVDAAYVRDKVAPLAASTDLSRYIL